MLHRLGVHYYPGKYWAIALPAYVCVAFLSIYFFYIAANLAATNPLDSPFTFADKWSKKMSHSQKRSSADEFSIPDISDISPEQINRLLYHAQQPATASAGLSRHTAFGSSANLRAE